MKRLLFSLITIGIVGSLVFGLSKAFFSDTETSSGNIFQAGAIDLKIDNTSYYNGAFWEGTSWELNDLTDQLFFDFHDIKPSDWGEDTVSLHVDNNDAWACVDLNLTRDDDNTCTGPELIDDPSCVENGDDWDGELGDNINFIFWVDDGDNVLETDENVLTAGPGSSILDGVKWVLADSEENNIGGNPGDPLVGLQTYYIGKAWCFGTLTPEPLDQNGEGPESNRTPATSTGGVSCDGSQLDNATQTDILMGDITFYAEQYRHNPNFVCEECFEEVFADSVHAADQAKRKDGSDVLVIRSNSSNALGAPDSVPINLSSPKWYSLGFGGTIIIKFASPVKDGPGDDLSVHEVTGGRSSYPLETAEIAVSQDGSNWFVLAEQATSQKNESDPGVTLLEISATGLPWIQYVRVTDTTNPSIHSATADGFDLDAIDAVFGSCGEPQ